MPQVPTPPASRHGSESPEVDQKNPLAVDSSAELLRSLDTLLERYLGLLDRHQKLQSELAKQLSSGFLSLAQANYTCPPGRRYGADYYDERMKATRKLSVQRDSPGGSVTKPACEWEKSTGRSEKGVPVDNPRCIFTTESTNQHALTGEGQGAEKCHPGKDSSQADQSKSDGDDGGTTKTEEPTEPPEPATSTEAQEPKAAAKKFRSLDPITWYGILVPPALRSAQRAFTDSIESQVPELASVVIEMQAVEREVNRLRQELGEK